MAVKLMLCPINWNNPNSVKGEKSFELGTYRRNIEKYIRRSLILHCVFHEITLQCHRAEIRQKAGLTGKKSPCTEFQIEEPERKILTRNLGGDKRIILKRSKEIRHNFSDSFHCFRIGSTGKFFELFNKTWNSTSCGIFLASRVPNSS